MQKGFFGLSTIAKCGAFEGAGKVFEKLPNWDVISWSALISGYAEHEYGKKAIDCSQEMQLESITFS